MYIYIQCKMAIRIFLAVLPLLSSFASLNICTFCIKIFYGSQFLLCMDNIVKSIFIYNLLNNTYMQAIDYTVYIQLEMAIFAINFEKFNNKSLPIKRISPLVLTVFLLLEPKLYLPIALVLHLLPFHILPRGYLP